jgi:hypothetical protein
MNHILGRHSGVYADPSLLGCYAVSYGVTSMRRSVVHRCTSEPTVTIYRSTQRDIPKRLNLQKHNSLRFGEEGGGGVFETNTG